MFQRTVDPRKAPDQPREVSVSFEKGTPVAVDSKPLGPAALLTELNAIAGEDHATTVDAGTSNASAHKAVAGLGIAALITSWWNV